MKIILLAASALALSTAAFAQSDTGTMSTPPPEGTPAAGAPANTPTNPGTPTTTPGDAAGLPPATDSTMGPGSGGDTGAHQAAPPVDDSNLPRCSRTVTDKCTQGGSAGHHRMKHKKTM